MLVIVRPLHFCHSCTVQASHSTCIVHTYTLCTCIVHACHCMYMLYTCLKRASLMARVDVSAHTYPVYLSSTLSYSIYGRVFSFFHHESATLASLDRQDTREPATIYEERVTLFLVGTAGCPLYMHVIHMYSENIALTRVLYARKCLRCLGVDEYFSRWVYHVITAPNVHTCYMHDVISKQALWLFACI